MAAWTIVNAIFVLNRSFSDAMKHVIMNPSLGQIRVLRSCIPMFEPLESYLFMGTRQICVSGLGIIRLELPRFPKAPFPNPRHKIYLLHQ